MKQIFRERGQGVVGLLVSSSLLILMVGAVFQVLDNTYKSQKSVAVSAEFANYVVELTQIVNDKPSCKSALLNQKVMASNYACDGTGGDDTTLTWESREYLRINQTKKGLKAAQFCVKKIDSSWTLGDAKKIPVKMLLELTKADNVGGRQSFLEEFYFNVLTDGGNPPLIQDCIDGYSATPAPVAATTCSAPSGITLTYPSHGGTYGDKTFTILWTTGGSCNGGYNGCQIEYYNPTSAQWASIGLYTSGVSIAANSYGYTTNGYFNCDLALPFAQTVTLPENGWIQNPTTPWTAGISLQMTRVSDRKVLVSNLGTIPCSVSVAAPLSTVDENCDGRWNDE